MSHNPKLHYIMLTTYSLGGVIVFSEIVDLIVTNHE